MSQPTFQVFFPLSEGLQMALSRLSGFFTRFNIYECKRMISIFVLLQIIEYVFEVAFYAPSGSFKQSQDSQNFQNIAHRQIFYTVSTLGYSVEKSVLEQ
jgi:hypothetical protein